MSAPGYGAEMCAHPGYARWMASVEAADAREIAWERETKAQRERWDERRVGDLLHELEQSARPALARALRAWLDKDAAETAEWALQKAEQDREYYRGEGRRLFGGW
jgi:hypothetical protein